MFDALGRLIGHIIPRYPNLELGSASNPLKRIYNDIFPRNATFDGTMTITGAQTLTGNTVHDGTVEFNDTTQFDAAVTFNAAVNGDGVAFTGFRRPVTRSTTATFAVATTDSGRVYIATRTSSTQTYTLPSAGTAGLTYTFICGHADGEILLSVTGSDTISVFTFAAVGADADTATVAPAGGTGIKNTAATNVIGDNVTLVSDGVTGWFSVGPATGIWASQ